MSMLFKRIKDWAVSIISFRTGDVIPVDGPIGTAKMTKENLLKETAQNALTGGVVQAFIPNETNAKQGKLYVYGGKTYAAKEDYNGAWNAAKFEEVVFAETTFNSKLPKEGLGEFFLNKVGISDAGDEVHSLDLFNLGIPVPKDEKNWFNPKFGKRIYAYITGGGIVYSAQNTETIIFKLPRNKSFMLGQGTYTRLTVLVTAEYPENGTTGTQFGQIEVEGGRNYIQFDTKDGEYVCVFFYNSISDTTATPEERLATMSCSSAELGYVAYQAPGEFGLLLGTDFINEKIIAQNIGVVSDRASDAVSAIYSFNPGTSLVPVSQYPGHTIEADGDFFNAGNDYTAEKFKAAPFMFVSGRSPGATDKCLGVVLDNAGVIISVIEEATGKTYDDFFIRLPANAAYVIVNSYLSHTGAKSAVYGEVKLAEKTYVAESLEPLNTAVFEYVPADEISSVSVDSGKCLKKDGTTDNNSGFQVAKFSVTGMNKVAVSGRSPGNNAYCLACAYASDDTLLQTYEIGSTGKDYVKFIIDLPQGVGYINVNAASTAPAAAYEVEKVKTFYTKEEAEARFGGDLNYWKGKTLWWCGTSIPAGGGSTNYPSICGTMLSATTINKAVGGSMCRANVRTGDYAGANFSNITSALTMTKAEIEAFITNYSTIQPTLTGGAPATLSVSDLERLRAASFEDRLLPYLDGTYDMPDLFVIDHGHNDWKYIMPDSSSDIGLEPTLANISGGVLAEDTYMTDNNCEKLELYVGSLDNVEPSKKAAFVASLNRNCYKGAINFLVTTILHHNPFARIVFISNYEYEHGNHPGYAPLILAQQDNASGWAFPLCEVYKKLGFSDHIVPGTKNLYPSISETYDRDVFKVYNPDGVHPHSQPDGITNEIYAGVVAEFLKTCR